MIWISPATRSDQPVKILAHAQVAVAALQSFLANLQNLFNKTPVPRNALIPLNALAHAAKGFYGRPASQAADQASSPRAHYKVHVVGQQRPNKAVGASVN